jgi:hypothetical protein
MGIVEGTAAWTVTVVVIKTGIPEGLITVRV